MLKASEQKAEARVERDTARVQFEKSSSRTCKKTEQLHRTDIVSPNKDDAALVGVDIYNAIDMQGDDYRRMKGKEEAYKDASKKYKHALALYRARQFQDLQFEVDSDSDLN